MSAVTPWHRSAPAERIAPVSDENARRARMRASQRAVFGLLRHAPEFSAHVVATTQQRVVLFATFVTLAGSFALWPSVMAQALVAGTSAGFIVSLAFRVVLAWFGCRPHPGIERDREEPLPIYTVLVPLFRESNVLAELIENLQALDYPAEKLDVKLVVEEDDTETRELAERLSPFEVIVVPPSKPRTKPKACNFALQFARGKHVVVYDAEDKPDRDQLRKAVAAFRRGPGISCFQAALSIERASGWLAHMFALDYGIWFRTLLPGLDRLHAPIPLGGTSNHFRTASLVAAGAWDPFNVTEDADLGVRLARLGHRVSMLDSDTSEEAPPRFSHWFRQRTRWMKGYMQTLLVHTRRPARLFQKLGLRGCMAVQLFLGGAVWSALVNPLLWVIFVASCVARPMEPSLLDMLARISGAAVVLANGLLVMLSFIHEGRRRKPGWVLFAVTYPLYWILISAAAYRALWQLLRDPFLWEKTPHGGASF